MKSGIFVHREVLAVFLVIFLLRFQSIGAAELNPSETAFFESKVRPLFAKHCYECHSSEAGKVKGGLLLDSKEGWMAGGDSGEVIEPGDTRKSLLIKSVHYTDPDLEMPPKYKLSASEIEILEHWIAIGAPDPSP